MKIWRSKCIHRDVRVHGDFGLRSADGSPRWDPCLVCDAKWHRYEVVETTEWRYIDRVGNVVSVTDDLPGLRRRYSGAWKVGPGARIVRVVKRTLRRSP